MRFVLVGTSHVTAPIDFRETLAFSEAQAAEALGLLSEDETLPEMLLLSTCNRTELLVRHRLPQHESAALPNRLIKDLTRLKLIESYDPAHFYTFHELAAVEHIFRVAAGLESMVLGEPQVFGQLKDAYRIASCVGSTGFMLNKLLHCSFKAGKRVRAETDIGAGAVSISLAAAELAAKLADPPGDYSVLIVGAGEMARLLGLYVRKAGFRKITICNRTERRAAALANDIGADWISLDQLEPAIIEHQLIITATDSQEPLITQKELRPWQAADTGRDLRIIDIGVPRNVSYDVEQIPRVSVHNIDALQETVGRNHDRRREQIPKVEAIIAEEIQSFLNWHRTLAVKPTIVELLDKYEAIRQDELGRCAKRMAPDDLEHLDVMTKRLVNKILHDPIVHLKNSQHNDFDNSEFWVEMVRNVFDLKGTADGEGHHRESGQPPGTHPV